MIKRLIILSFFTSFVYGQKTQGYFENGLIKFKPDELNKEIEEYSKAIETDTNCFNCFYYRGLSYKRLGKYSNAILDYEKAVKINRNSAVLYNDMGIAYYRLNNDKKALECFNTAISNDPKLAIAYNNRGVIKFELGDPEGGHSDYEIAEKLGLINGYDDYKLYEH